MDPTELRRLLKEATPAEKASEAFHLIHRVATHQSTASYMSIPPDPKRDADLLVAGALESYRDLLAALPSLLDALAACRSELGIDARRAERAEAAAHEARRMRNEAGEELAALRAELATTKARLEEARKVRDSLIAGVSSPPESPDNRPPSIAATGLEYPFVADSKAVAAERAEAAEIQGARGIAATEDHLKKCGPSLDEMAPHTSGHCLPDAPVATFPALPVDPAADARMEGLMKENEAGPHSFCPECGPDVGVDEDGCCTACGSNAMGSGVDAIRASLVAAKQSAGSWEKLASDNLALAEKLTADLASARAALTKISAIRDSIVGAQGFNFSEHAYPLVAILDAAGFPGAGYKIAAKNLGTLIEQIKAAEAERDSARAEVVALTGRGEALTHESDDTARELVLVAAERDSARAERAEAHEELADAWDPPAEGSTADLARKLRRDRDALNAAALSEPSPGWVVLDEKKAGQIVRLLERLRIGIWGATADDIAAAIALLSPGVRK